MSTSSENKSSAPWKLSSTDSSGEFKRHVSQFRNWISAEPGAEFPPEKGRYHLYVSYACPWAHRTLITRKLKGLEDFVSYSVVHWHMLEKGWRFVTTDEVAQGTAPPGDNVVPDPLHPEFTHLRQVYFEQDANYGGRFVVPTLYDKKTRRIVSNESSEIIRMFYTAFDAQLPQPYAGVDLYPADLRSQIDETNEWTYNDINNGVYKSGFAQSQQAYDAAVAALFAALARVERHLAATPGPFYHGARVTEADVRLYPTIVRFDPVYVQHFKCNLRDVRSGFPALHRWLRAVYWDHAAFRDTTQFEHIKKHYTMSHRQINPFSIVPAGPEKDILRKDEEVAAVAAAKEKKGAGK